MRLVKAEGIETTLRSLECSRASLDRWLAACEKHGMEGLIDASRRPRCFRITVPAGVGSVTRQGLEFDFQSLPRLIGPPPA